MIISNEFSDVLEVWNSLSKNDKDLICTTNFSDSPLVKYRKVLKIDNIPVSFLELYSLPNDNENAYIVIGTNPNYRNLGYTKKLILLAEEDNLKMNLFKKFYWTTTVDNKISKHLAEKLGYVRINNRKFVKNF